ncbi:MAG: helix-turn-helix domain-containing protein [Bacilli bacterium]
MNDFETLTKTIAENLTYYRKKADLTQLQLAEHFNYSDKSVSKWERGESIPDTLVMKALADYYGITIDDFFKKEKVSTTRQIRNKKRLFIILLSIGLVWLVAAFIFLLCVVLFKDFDFSWLCFIYALVPSFILLVVWSAIYHQRLQLLISVSGLVWTSALCLFLSFLLMVPAIDKPFLIFIIGIPLQILAVLWYFLRTTIKERKKTLN